jgi:hypothetical protein
MGSMGNREWIEIGPSEKRWLTGWIVVMCKDLSQKIIWHDKIDDSMLFYYPIPSYLTKEQLEKIKTHSIDLMKDRT